MLVVIAPTPQDVIPKCARVLEKMKKTKTGTSFASRGMDVNDNRRNTEALLQFNGTGAAKVKNDFTVGSQQIHVEHCLASLIFG